MDRNHGVRGILKRPTSWKSVGQEELVPQRPLQASLRQSAVLVAVPVRIQPGGKVEEGLLALAAGVRVGAAGRVRTSPYESLERGATVCVRPTRVGRPQRAAMSFCPKAHFASAGVCKSSLSKAGDWSGQLPHGGF